MDARQLRAHLRPPYVKRLRMLWVRAMRELAAPWAERVHARRNLRSKSPVTGDAPVIVSMTTYGARLETAYYALESIGRGKIRPYRLVLWIQDREEFEQRPASIRRLESRGLEVRLTRKLRSHTKYFPALADAQQQGVPLVTVDDDVLYPRFWLRGLLAAAEESPRTVVCYLSHRVSFDERQHLSAYASWTKNWSASPSPRVFSVGVSGALYPLEAVDALMCAGEGFLERAPLADDVWLNSVVTSVGIPTRQVSDIPSHFAEIRNVPPGLARLNVDGGENDRQIKASYGDNSLDFMLNSEPTAGGTS